MHLLLVGISHRTAPVELRERVDFQARDLAAALRALAERGSAREAVVVSTCNRAEMYVACDESEPTRQDLLRFLSDYNQVAAAEHFRDFLRTPAEQAQFARSGLRVATSFAHPDPSPGMDWGSASQGPTPVDVGSYQQLVTAWQAAGQPSR